MPKTSDSQYTVEVIEPQRFSRTKTLGGRKSTLADRTLEAEARYSDDGNPNMPYYMQNVADPKDLEPKRRA